MKVIHVCTIFIVISLVYYKPDKPVSMYELVNTHNTRIITCMGSINLLYFCGMLVCCYKDTIGKVHPYCMVCTLHTCDVVHNPTTPSGLTIFLLLCNTYTSRVYVMY